MTWKEAKKEIQKHVVVGTDVNSVKSHGRVVKCVCDWGYRIPRGKDSDMKVTWDMLEKCWNGMVGNGGIYDPKAVALPAPCYVQTIHMIFEKAGLT